MSRLPLPLRGSTRLPRSPWIPPPERRIPPPRIDIPEPRGKRYAIARASCDPQPEPRLTSPWLRYLGVQVLELAPINPPPRRRFLRLLRTPPPRMLIPEPFLQPQGIFIVHKQKTMSTSQGDVKDVLPKSFPFSNRRKEMFPPTKFNLGYHVDVLGKYSKKIPKREISALDRKSTSTVKWWDDTRQYDPHYYRSH